LPLPDLPARRDACRRAIRMSHRHALMLAPLALATLLASGRLAPAADISIFGKWEFVEAVPAPWTAPEDAARLQAEGNRLLKTEVTFDKGKVASKFKPFDCKSKVIYTPNSIEVDALFQGNLPEPNPAAAAARLGFPRGDIPSVDVRCLKAFYTFHFRDSDTALINYDRVIYTLKRR
jgi:hypothetical protein